MDDPFESASDLPWLWVIEALTGFKEINLSTLQDLIDVAPVSPDDFGENTKELVALRCLEELFCSPHGINHDASPGPESRAGFDFSLSCEDVLQDILLEMPLANLKLAGTKPLKWDVSPFIMHKRASTVKCHLEQLKESIVEGTHPYIDYLKERSGLALQNGVYPVNVNVGECNQLSEEDNGNFTCAENMGAKENPGSLILENGNKSSKKHWLDNNFSPSKRTRVYPADDFFGNTKKIRCHASVNFESKKEKLLPQLQKGVSENSTETIILNSEKGGLHIGKDNRKKMHERSFDDNHARGTASNECRGHHNEVFHDESNIPFDATVMPQHTSGGEDCQQQLVKLIPINVALPDEIQHEISGRKPWSKHETDLHPNGSQQTVAGDIAQDDIGNGCRVDISGDGIVHQDEIINPLMKNHDVLIPQHILGPDSSAFIVSTDQNFGMQCNKGGQSLVCDATTLPLAVPESCFGMTTIIVSQHTSGYEPFQYASLDKINDTEHQVDLIPTNVDDTDKIDHMINELQSELKEPNMACLNVSEKAVILEPNNVNGCGSESSSDSDGYHDENIDLAAKKNEFLTSQCTFGYDFSTSTGQNLCMKCNEGGQLLVCKTTTCPLMVHENCLGASGQFDASGNFCPFCAYSHAISEYLEAKKNASLARKELAIFVNEGIIYQTMELLREFQQECSLSRKSSKSKHIHVKNNGNAQLSWQDEDRVDHVSKHVNEINSCQFKRSQQQGPTSCIYTCREKERDQVLNLKSSTGGRVLEKNIPTDHIDRDGGDKYTYQNANIVSVNQINTGEEIPQQMLEQHNMDGTVEPVCAHDIKKDEISEDECEKHVTSRYSLRFQKRETGHEPQSSPLSRRKKIPWTTEEEQLIREGVLKFGFNDPKIPWKKILAFGSHVFEKDGRHRTSQDLKDKWKNMCRARSKRDEKDSS